jgi:curved DNA-binding protein CbpA
LISDEASRLPLPVEGVDMRSLPIGPEEAFILSRVDGSTNESDLAAITGLDAGRVRDGLARLAVLGAIRFDAPRPSAVRAAVSAAPPERRPSDSYAAATNGAEAIVDVPTVKAAPQLFSPAELDEPADLDVDRKKRILEAFYGFPTKNHYEVLGVQRTAEKKAIKQAYFELVPVFHPDRYYGKKLGSYQAKLAKAFACITEAHEVLSRAATREEYDRYLACQAQTAPLESALANEGAVESEVERIQREIEREAEALASERPSAPPAQRVTTRLPAQPPLGDDARRRMLARRLRPSGPPPAFGSNAPPAASSAPSDPDELRQRAADSLRRHFGDRVATARLHRVRQHLEAAESALAAGKHAQAVNAARIAAALGTDDPALAERIEQVRLAACLCLSKTFEEQGAYEQRSGNFAKAARSFERAAQGRPNEASLYHRAACCLLDAKEDLKLAAEHGKRAVALAPENAAMRLTLARVYLAAGLRVSGIAELERAAALAPADPAVRDLLKQAKRGEI